MIRSRVSMRYGFSLPTTTGPAPTHLGFSSLGKLGYNSGSMIAWPTPWDQPRPSLRPADVAAFPSAAACGARQAFPTSALAEATRFWQVRLPVVPAEELPQGTETPSLRGKTTELDTRFVPRSEVREHKVLEDSETPKHGGAAIGGDSAGPCRRQVRMACVVGNKSRRTDNM